MRKNRQLQLQRNKLNSNNNKNNDLFCLERTLRGSFFIVFFDYFMIVNYSCIE